VGQVADLPGPCPLLDATHSASEHPAPTFVANCLYFKVGG